MSKVIFTALFGNYEELKEPSVITPGWRYICFTDQPITSDIWEIVPTGVYGLNVDKIPTWSPRLAARYTKILHPIIAETDQSIWVDASFRIDVDLDEFWARNARGSFSAARHPLRDDCDEEILACIISNRCDLPTLQAQREAYKDIPKHNGVISSGILLRTPESIPLCTAWWDELIKWSTRDQVAFCRVSPNFEHHMFDFDYRREKEFIYWKHKHLR